MCGFNKHFYPKWLAVDEQKQLVTEPTIFEITSLISQLLLLDKSQTETLLKPPDGGVSSEKNTLIAHISFKLLNEISTMY